MRVVGLVERFFVELFAAKRLVYFVHVLSNLNQPLGKYHTFTQLNSVDQIHAICA